MGQQFGAICGSCGHHFDVRKGGGFVFELLQCDTCSNTRSVGHAEVWGPYQAYRRSPAAEQDHYHALQKHAGRCRCDGHFLLSAPPRCPRCRSTEYQVDPDSPSIMYDQAALPESERSWQMPVLIITTGSRTPCGNDPGGTAAND
jgi:hypothetical protein